MDGNSINDMIQTTATKLAGDQAPTLVTPDFTSLGLQLLTSLLSSCFGGGTPASAPAGAPAAPLPNSDAVAARLKNIDPVEKAVLRQRSKRQYVRSGMSSNHGLLFANSVITIGQEQSQENLSGAISHIQGVNDSFPDMEMF